MTVAEFLGYHDKRFGGRYVRTTPIPWMVTACARIATTFMSNWVLALAAQGGGGESGDSQGEGRGGLIWSLLIGCIL